MKKELSPARKIEMVIELIESGNSPIAFHMVDIWASKVRPEFICQELVPFLRNDERDYWAEYEPMLSDLKEALAKAGGSELSPLHATIEAQRQRIAELEAENAKAMELLSLLHGMDYTQEAKDYLMADSDYANYAIVTDGIEWLNQQKQITGDAQPTPAAAPVADAPVQDESEPDTRFTTVETVIEYDEESDSYVAFCLMWSNIPDQFIALDPFGIPAKSREEAIKLAHQKMTAKAELVSREYGWEAYSESEGE